MSNSCEQTTEYPEQPYQCSVCESPWETGDQSLACCSGEKASQQTTEDKDALDHLGHVLNIFAELSPTDRCRALDDALEFYNAARPNFKVGPQPRFVTRLVQVGPLDWPFIKSAEA